MTLHAQDSVPFVDLKAQYAAIGNELDWAATRVLASSDFILGEDVAAFEGEFASFCETAHAVGVDSGTSALELALRALGVGPGDEVITAANTFIATALAISYTGATPVFADELFPDHGIVAEEGGRAEMKSEYRWFVDPLDGTTNFAHGFPVFNVTLGLAKANRMIAGVVFDPERNEMFAAERGAGATLNGKKIQVSKAKLLEDSLVATGFPSRKRHQNVNVHFYYQLAMLTHGVRRAGAAAIDLAWTACGRLDAFWEFGLNPWDMAAGTLLVEEAGGKVSSMAGEPLDLHGAHLLVDNGLIHEEMLALFKDIFAAKYPFEMPGMQAAAPGKETRHA